jgi:predicted RNA binding protein YcfA (HicA-like mRNA interferase family)
VGNVPVLKPAEVVAILRRLGFAEGRQRGSRKQFRNSAGRTTTVPFHSGRDIAPVLLRQIAKRYRSHGGGDARTGLIASLDKSDPALDAMWLKEADDRMAAYRAGKLAAIDAEHVFADLGKLSNS